MISMCLYPRFKREHCLKVSLIKIKALLFTEVTTAMVNLSNILRDLFFCNFQAFIIDIQYIQIINLIKPVKMNIVKFIQLKSHSCLRLFGNRHLIQFSFLKLKQFTVF